MKFLAVTLAIWIAFFSCLLSALSEFYKGPERTALVARAKAQEIELHYLDAHFSNVLQNVEKLENSVDSAAQQVEMICKRSKLLLRELEQKAPEPDTTKTF